MRRREFLSWSAASATVLAAGSSVFAAPKGKADVGRTGPVGSVPKDPYKHLNQVAKLPAWDGQTSSNSVPGSMRMFRGNLTHGYYGSGKLSEKLVLKWKFRMWDFETLKHGKPVTWRGTGWTGQALKYGDYVFAGSTGGHFHCFEALTGKLVWVYAATRMFKGSPSLYQNKIYVPNVDNHLRCLDAATGKVVWDWAGPSDMDSSPRLLDGKLYVGGEDGNFKCFDAETGKLIYSQSFGVGEGEKPGSGGIESSLAIADGQAYFGHLDGHVRAVSLKDGALAWKTKIGFDIDASPLLVGDRLFVGAEEGKPTFHCLDRTNGKTVWTKHIPAGIWSTAAAIDRSIIVCGNNGWVYRLAQADGAVEWEEKIGVGIWASPSVVDGKVLFGAYDRTYRMLDVATGKLIWSADIGDRSHSGAAIEDGHVWVGGASGYFYCFGPA